MFTSVGIAAIFGAIIWYTLAEEKFLEKLKEIDSEENEEL